MNYQEILNKKARLSKYSGRKLTKKLAAYEKAVARYGSNGKAVSAAPKTQKSPKAEPVKVESADPEWAVYLPGETGGKITVNATSEKKARAAARKSLGLRALPAGTKVEKA